MKNCIRTGFNKNYIMGIRILKMRKNIVFEYQITLDEVIKNG